MTETPILQVCDLKKYYDARIGGARTTVRAVDGVSLTVRRGETLGLVGESGCGKSTLGRAILRLQKPSSGSVLYDGTELTDKNIRDYRRKMQIIFQDPAGSLDPRMRVFDIIEEALIAAGIGKDRISRAPTVFSLLERVGLSREHAMRYPREFSGGQQQRIGIARALAVDPEFLVCDEPVSALDVSCQSQIINLLEDMQEQLGLTYLFIAHDLSVVRHISDRIAVMYLGKVVELGTSEEIGLRPQHPYTRSLIASIPIPDPKVSRSRTLETLEGELPSVMAPPEGCRFHTRCKYACARCTQESPALHEVAPGHFCACHLFEA